MSAADAARGPTRDTILGGRVRLWQPREGYRAGVDAVFLAAACPAVPGDRVLDLGCGAGAASLCLGARVPGLTLVGVEREPEMVRYARTNAALSPAAFRVVHGDVARLPAALRRMSFDHVIANPPYFLRSRSVRSGSALREAAMGEGTPLSAWIDTAARRLRPRGWLTMIQRAERLGEILAELDGRLGSVCVQPLAPREGRPAHMVLVRARKGGRAPLALFPPIVVHEGPRHMRDGDSYPPSVAAVLRDAKALPGFGS